MKVPSNARRFDGQVQIMHVESEREQYFLKWLWGKRLLIQTQSLDEETGKLDKTIERGDRKYELLVSKMIKSKGKNPKFARFEQTIVKAYYVAVEGSEFEQIDLHTEMNRLGDFSSEAEAGKIASRLELMVSTAAWAPNKSHPLQFELKPSDFELVEENANEGCGFVPLSFLEEHLGATLAQKAGAIQVRIFGAKIGWYKGMLTRKQDICRIQLPPTMRKVDKSICNQSPDWVFLVVTHVYPSEACKMMGRYLNPHLPNPSETWRQRNLQGLADNAMYWHLLQINGVPEGAIQKYSEQSTEWAGRKHASLLGIADATGELPKDTVFITGSGTVPESSPGSCFICPLMVTRFPCTEKDDLVVLNCIKSKPQNMTPEHWEFMEKLPFGMIVFAAPGDGKLSIPQRIADGDLDGDCYTCLWVCASLSALLLLFCMKIASMSSLHWTTPLFIIIGRGDCELRQGKQGH